MLFVCVASQCFLADSAYTSRELERRYANSGASIVVVVNEDGPTVVHEMSQSVGLNCEEAGKRIVVVGAVLG